ncbi:hypothetical protein F5878DRAFT_692857 [Lentinula raphanica]|uniref:Uncharacterized protein n=1 Tax=Lentinula raphanica TaxID=153919 RepID=A0AA38P311_9AGAR|nr:hypothetical protein F5878DRAFT_692857 [Lentinula raphanica]
MGNTASNTPTSSQSSSMQLHTSLPNELLYSIVEYIAYTPKLPDSRSESPFKCASPELLAFSVANWQLRQVSLPFLFANIKIRDVVEVHQLEKCSALFVKFTKVLVIKPLPQLGDQTISKILPQLKKLSEVELPDCRNRTELLRSILAHPTVTSVVVDELPEESMCNDDLSKVALPRRKSYRAMILPEYQKYFDRGMRILRLQLSEGDSIITQFESINIPGLKEIRIFIHGYGDKISWAHVLSSNHPTLNELWLLGRARRYLKHVVPPVLSPFMKESQQEKLHSCFIVRRVGLRRTNGSSYSPPEWYVMGLSLETTPGSTSIIEILTLVASSFPKLEVLTLGLNQHEEMYDIDDLASVLARFSSLRILYLDEVFARLKFGPEFQTLMPLVQQFDTPDVFDEMRARAESGLLLFASHLAKQVRTLDSIHMSDTGYGYDNSGNRVGSWFLTKWLHVLNGNRDISELLSV